MNTEEQFRFPVRLSVRNPVDLIAAVPYLIGFHPKDCIVALGSDGRDGFINLASGCGPLSESDHDPSDIATRLADSFAEQGCTRAVVLGYGPAELVAPCLLASRNSLVDRGVAVAETLRVTEDRYWSYDCSDPDCCPPEGVAYDVHRSTIPAAAVAAGVRVRADRDEILALVEPVGGAERAEMTRATREAEERAARLWGAAPSPRHEALTAEGVRTVRAVVSAALEGAPPPDHATVAWLGLLLVDLRVRDEAWAHIDREHVAVHVGLWSYVLCRVDPAYAAAPASLLGFAAWQNDDPVLADAALARALEADPDYSMAQLVRRAVYYGLPPRKWEGFGPDWLADQAPVGDGATALRPARDHDS
ncbi:DUF4192 domain-containing protein [Thermobifida cellulosilytica]|uniref:DUF4192 domain-containing protein n=1 Tax=Thermobifida cellulosilytica TB100 TaxID=665004 RepID=A0A147KHN7_THECS|nr:DUF4192 domain-containing protein [Thermobifida cellulosilytica]KUP96813.1 hypothetical protein AC529_10200 [Thermobifida cellulosilytica TB100]